MSDNLFILLILLAFTGNFNGQDNFKRDSKPNNDLKVFATCIENIGCIDTNEKWYDPQHRPVNLEPLDRHTIRTEFLLMKQSKNDSKEVLYDILTLKSDTVKISGFKSGKTTIFLIHDFTSHGHTGWIKHIALAINAIMEANVISVDWEAGAEPPFDQAIANARVVALELIAFIKMLKKHFSINGSMLHLIGHGVGAHIAGYVGKNVTDIARITGLDPTGYRFEHMPSLVRLDPDDAKYVEVLHTDHFNSRSQGTLQAMGHSDFYINNAGHQPGCNDSYNFPRFSDLTRASLKEGTILPACSHKRAFKYYISAITSSDCKFVGIACPSYQNFHNGSCSDCESNVCASFDLCPPPKHVPKLTKFYVNTDSEPPFCMHAYQVNVSIENHPYAKKTDGYFEFILIDTKNKITFATGSILGTAKRTYVPGNTYTLVVYAAPPAVTHMKEAKVKWTSTASALFKKPIYVRYVSIRRIPMLPEDLPINGMCPYAGTEIKDGAYIQFNYCDVEKIKEEDKLAALKVSPTTHKTTTIKSTTGKSTPKSSTKSGSSTTKAGITKTTITTVEKSSTTTAKTTTSTLAEEKSTTESEYAAEKLSTTENIEKSEPESVAEQSSIITITTTENALAEGQSKSESVKILTTTECDIGNVEEDIDDDNIEEEINLQAQAEKDKVKIDITTTAKIEEETRMEEDRTTASTMTKVEETEKEEETITTTEQAEKEDEITFKTTIKAEQIEEEEEETTPLKTSKTEETFKTTIKSEQTEVVEEKNTPLTTTKTEEMSKTETTTTLELKLTTHRAIYMKQDLDEGESEEADTTSREESQNLESKTTTASNEKEIEVTEVTEPIKMTPKSKEKEEEIPVVAENTTCVDVTPEEELPECEDIEDDHDDHD